MNLLKKISSLIKKEKFYIYKNGNKFFYTRNGFGVKTTPENKTKKIMAFVKKNELIKGK